MDIQRLRITTECSRVSEEGYTMPQIARPVIIGSEEKILVTGASGFIGLQVVRALVKFGFRHIVAFCRDSSRADLVEVLSQQGSAQVEFVRGNLLSRPDCEAACKDTAVIIHLAAGTGEKSFPDAYMNSVVTTRNLLEAGIHHGRLKRFSLVSSFAVYTNQQKSMRLDESCPLEDSPERQGDAYCFAKVKQEQIVREYAEKFAIPFTIARPGSVYGPGKRDITGRVGLGTFGIFLHLGGSNRVPFTFVENCAEAIALAALVQGVDGEAFNIVDDELPSSRQFLRQYKKSVKNFKSVYVPHLISHALCCLWERYSRRSQGQLPLAFSNRRWHSEWRNTSYSNEKLKTMLGWAPNVPTSEGMKRFFESCAQDLRNA
jgi:nucleoside-diphosphate-sugar epimerase